MKNIEKIPTIDQFIEAYERFVESIKDNAKQLGNMLVPMMQNNPNTLDDLSKKGFCRVTLDKLYRIGLDQLDSRLLLDDSPAAKIASNLPLVQQQKLLAEGVPVIIDVTPDGKGVQKIKPLHMVTEKESKKAFRADGSLCPASEQIEIAKAARHNIHVLPAERFHISEDGETVAVLEKTEFTLSRWMEIGELAIKRQTQYLQSNVNKNQIAKGKKQ